MKRKLLLVVLCMVFLAAGCQSAAVSNETQDTSIPVRDDITLHPIAEGVWVHTTYFDLPDYGRYPANGLVVIEGKEAMLIDLPWTDEQTAALFDWIEENHGATVKTVVPTHFHEDCMGGLAEAHRRGALSYGLDKTIEIARQKELPVPQDSLPLPDHGPLRPHGRCRDALRGRPHDRQRGRLAAQAAGAVRRLPHQVPGLAVPGQYEGRRPGGLSDHAPKGAGCHPQAEDRCSGPRRLGRPELIEHTLELCPGNNPKP